MRRSDDARTDADGEGYQGHTGGGILEKVGPTGAQQGRTGAVVFTVVGGVEAIGGSGQGQSISITACRKDRVSLTRGMGLDVQSRGHYDWEVWYPRTGSGWKGVR